MQRDSQGLSALEFTQRRVNAGGSAGPKGKMGVVADVLCDGDLLNVMDSSNPRN